MSEILLNSSGIREVLVWKREIMSAFCGATESILRQELENRKKAFIDEYGFFASFPRKTSIDTVFSRKSATGIEEVEAYVFFNALCSYTKFAGNARKRFMEILSAYLRIFGKYEVVLPDNPDKLSISEVKNMLNGHFDEFASFHAGVFNDRESLKKVPKPNQSYFQAGKNSFKSFKNFSTFRAVCENMISVKAELDEKKSSVKTSVSLNGEIEREEVFSFDDFLELPRKLSMNDAEKDNFSQNSCQNVL